MRPPSASIRRLPASQIIEQAEAQANELDRIVDVFTLDDDTRRMRRPRAA